MREAIQDYLKIIYEIQQQEGKVTTNRLAQQLGIAPASVTGMIKKLAQMELVKYQRYQGVKLTSRGEQIALAVIRHHRIAELFLAQVLGIPWDKVHQEAEKWEHVLSEEVVERMDAWLGGPKTDPHGAPIPNKQLQLEYSPRIRLADVTVPCQVKVVEVSDHDPSLLRYLDRLNIYPDTIIEILSIEPFDQSRHIRIQNTEHVLSEKVAQYIWVVKQSCKDEE